MGVLSLKNPKKSNLLSLLAETVFGIIIGKLLTVAGD
jgi:hypothetical protein